MTKGGVPFIEMVMTPYIWFSKKPYIWRARVVGGEGEIDFKEWVHLTMEAEKYQVPESACQTEES